MHNNKNKNKSSKNIAKKPSAKSASPAKKTASTAPVKKAIAKRVPDVYHDPKKSVAKLIVIKGPIDKEFNLLWSNIKEELLKLSKDDYHFEDNVFLLVKKIQDKLLDSKNLSFVLDQIKNDKKVKNQAIYWKFISEFNDPVVSEKIYSYLKDTFLNATESKLKNKIIKTLMLMPLLNKKTKIDFLKNKRLL